MTTPARSRRDDLLDRCIEVIANGGFSDRSLRQLAAESETSHRMLIYHFGSRAGLLSAVVARVEAQQRATLAALDRAGDRPLIEICREFWAHISDPSTAPMGRVFFEVFSHALYGREYAADMAESLVTAWVRPLAELYTAHGVPVAQAAALARLGPAVARGLLLDLYLTGDREAVDAAAEAFFSAVIPGVRPRRRRRRRSG